MPTPTVSLYLGYLTSVVFLTSCHQSWSIDLVLTALRYNDSNPTTKIRHCIRCKQKQFNYTSCELQWAPGLGPGTSRVHLVYGTRNTSSDYHQALYTLAFLRFICTCVYCDIVVSSLCLCCVYFDIVVSLLCLCCVYCDFVVSLLCLCCVYCDFVVSLLWLCCFYVVAINLLTIAVLLLFVSDEDETEISHTDNEDTDNDGDNDVVSIHSISYRQ